MYDKENEYVPLNFQSLAENPAVWEVIKEELNYLSGDCLMKIITAAKEQGMQDQEIFFPAVAEIEIEFKDPFATSVEDDSTKED
jgi:hypothetical protein